MSKSAVHHESQLESADNSADLIKSVDKGLDGKSGDRKNDKMASEMAIDKVRQQIKLLQSKVVGEMDKKLGVMVEDLISEVNAFNLFRARDELLHKQKKTGRTGELAEKIFVARNSLLSDLFEVKHIRTIYHIFLVTLMVMFLNISASDYAEHGRVKFGLGLIRAAFGKFHYALLVWVCMFLSSLCVYPCFNFWAKLRPIKNDENLLKLWDFCWLIILIGYQIVFIILPVKGVVYFAIKPASSMAALMELVRFMMKSHAFVRSNAPRVLYGKTKVDAEDESALIVKIPSFSQFVYFLFCPTLVYRDEYPRTKVIYFKKAFINFVEVAGTIFLLSFVMDSFLLPVFRKLGETAVPFHKLIVKFLNAALPATIVLLCGFYCLLHAWMNACAELLRFSDRLFYKDWWNATSFAGYYRTWNVVVHDWLYEYIYKDTYNHVFNRNRLAATLSVFTTSAIFHELILAFTFRFFYPVMFVMFNFAGVWLFFLTKKIHNNVGNIFMWLALSVGIGLLISLYIMEYYARIHCPVVGDTIWDYIIPVSWSCKPITSSANFTVTV